MRCATLIRRPIWLVATVASLSLTVGCFPSHSVAYRGPLNVSSEKGVQKGVQFGVLEVLDQPTNRTYEWP